MLIASAPDVFFVRVYKDWPYNQPTSQSVIKLSVINSMCSRKAHCTLDILHTHYFAINR